MSHLVPSISSLLPTDGVVQNEISGGSQQQSSLRATSIHILDDDSLLNVFYLYRPYLLGEDKEDDDRLVEGEQIRKWVGENWWYKLARVCQRWRNLIFGSASYLDLSLVCTSGTPVADMLAHSPPLPLVISLAFSQGYFDNSAITSFFTKDERSITLALKQRDRIRCVNLAIPGTNLPKLIAVIDGEYPVLEYLYINRTGNIWRNDTTFIFPETFQAPHLRHLSLTDFALPIGSRLFTTAVGLVTLDLSMTPPSTYIHLNTLLQWISFMPQLETLAVSFYRTFALTYRDVERKLSELTHAPITTPVTLPNLHSLTFRGTSTYLEELICRIPTSRLKKLRVDILEQQRTLSIPRVMQFVNTTENLRFDSAKLMFSRWNVRVRAYPRGKLETYALHIGVGGDRGQQVSSVAQISTSLNQMFSAVKHLTVESEAYVSDSEEHDEVDHTKWRKLLRSFSSVETLRIDDCFLDDISRCLQSHPLVLLPQLQELTYYRRGNTNHPFTSFIDARQNAGRSITVVSPCAGSDLNT